jgi:hypothetical protein
MERWGWLLMLCIWLISAMGSGQNLVVDDTLVLKALQSPAGPGDSMVRFSLSQELEYNLSCTSIIFYNWHQGNNTNLITLVHFLKYRSVFTRIKNVKIINNFFHTLGMQYYFDSISRFQPDENTLDTRIEVRVGKRLTFALFSNLTTRIFNSFCHTTDQNGNLIKVLNASFLTPLLWTFSTGFGWTLPDLGFFSLGLSAGKFTWIRDKRVFDQQNCNSFYGVSRGKNHLFEYGLSMHVLIDREFQKRIHWNCDLLVFKDAGKPFDVVLKNIVGIRISKFLKSTIQTRIYYEKEVSKNIQVENLVSLGFYFNL